MTIKEAQNLKTLKLEGLVGKTLIYESTSTKRSGTLKAIIKDPKSHGDLELIRTCQLEASTKCPKKNIDFKKLEEGHPLNVTKI